MADNSHMITWYLGQRGHVKNGYAVSQKSVSFDDVGTAWGILR